MAKKICIVGINTEDGLLLTTMKEKFGDDIILITPDEAKEQGVKMEDIANIPTMKIVAPPIIPVVKWGEYKTGKERRRERRKKERKLNK